MFSHIRKFIKNVTKKQEVMINYKIGKIYSKNSKKEESISSVGLLQLRPQESTLLQRLLQLLPDHPRNIHPRLRRP